jgi:hypothetical protein
MRIKRLWIMLTMLTFVFSSFIAQSKETPLMGHIRWLPDTWSCENCGYENYVGIGNCGVCGERRGG